MTLAKDSGAIGLHCRRCDTPSVASIKAAVCWTFGVPPIEMVSERRSHNVARPRQVAMYLARELTPFSLPHIGRLFGNRDHTTVIHACRQVELRIVEDEALARKVQEIVAAVKSTVHPEKSDKPSSVQFLETA
jgi:chromosomal replication initiator protein